MTRAHASQADAIGPALQPAERIVEKYEGVEVSDHPFFARLQRHPVDLRAIWLLMANLREGISLHFVSWLAHAIGHVPDRRIGSLLAKQLNDELGNGSSDRIHSVLLDKFVTALELWRPSDATPALLEPGRQVAEATSALFARDNPYSGVGALVVSEIFAKKMDRCLGDEIRRQHELSSDVLVWLDLHERLEVDHADDSAELANLIPRQGENLAAVWQGATAEWSVLWQFLSDVDRLSLQLTPLATGDTAGRPG
jgi:pyrroloquinoline quinone (PQQ) biosynthesis protein C